MTKRVDHKPAFHITAPMTPGSSPVVVTAHPITLAEARSEAQERFGHRRDLTRQDVRIELTESGRLRCYAGPLR
jgi:hypothetical protein